jgi:hypothetical protein
MGCRSAALDADPIAMIAGKNYQGKSSTLLAISAALAGQTLPLGVKKQDVRLLITDGAPAAEAEITTDKGSSRITWPKAEHLSSGERPPSASPIAAGLLSPVELGTKELIELIRSITAANPTYKELEDELRKAQLDEKYAKSLWENINRDGWDATYKRAADKGREFKAQWNYVTGESYGSKKGEDWTPAGWEADLAGKESPELESEIDVAKVELEAIIAREAVVLDKRKALEEKAARLPALRKEYEEAQKAYSLAQLGRENAVNMANKAMEDLPGASFDFRGVCPGCGKKLGVLNGAFVDISGYSEGDFRKSKETFEKYKVKVEALTDEESKLEAKLKELKAEGDAAKAAEAELRDIHDPDTAGVISQKREAVKTAEKRLLLYKQYKQASDLHGSIVKNQAILNVLDERGLRQTAMRRGLADFNAKLAEVAGSCGFGAVTLDEQLYFAYKPAGKDNNIPYLLLSASERFRLRTTLQIAIALLDRSQAVVIDGIDILDNEGRKGVLKALSVLPVKSFVGVTADMPEKVPNLAKIGAGQTYWAMAGEVK